MSVLSCSEVQYVGEQSSGMNHPAERTFEEPVLLQVDCLQKRSCENLSLTSPDSKQSSPEFDYYEDVVKSNCHFEDAKETPEDEISGYVDTQHNASPIVADNSYSNGEDEYLPSALHELSDLACKAVLEQRVLPVQPQDNGLPESSNAQGDIVLKINGEHGSNQEGALHQLGNESTEQDHTVAVWVKWRGKWQMGIRCPKVDCPLQTLKAKPRHQRKNYLSVFFLRSRTYSWVDTLLVCSIDESPEPLAYGTHQRWRALVKDLSVPRRYVMHKLAVSMLNLSDQLHIEAVTGNARMATAWEEFATEASQSQDYSDLGKMLLKLKTMILPAYLNQEWSECTFDIWAQRCRSAQSAECIEVLTQELADSVLWKEVERLCDAPLQSELGVEWKSWKQEAIKRLSFFHPKTTIQSANRGPFVAPQTSNKRAKLDIYRKGVHINGCRDLSEAGRVEIDHRDSNYHSLMRSAGKMEALFQVAATSDCGTNLDRWNGVAGKSGDTKSDLRSGLGASADHLCGKAIVPVNNDHDLKMYRKCQAFIEAKGRQCGRWANDGDIYCCVHLNSLSTGKVVGESQVPSAEAPMCKGTTTLGNNCKHRARYGSEFCKKHFLHSGRVSVGPDDLCDPNRNQTEKKSCGNEIMKSIIASSMNCVNGYSPGEGSQTSLQDNLIPITVGETLDETNCLMKKSELYNELRTPVNDTTSELSLCIGHYGQTNNEPCSENAKKHTLYCEKHLPRFLKRARDGRSRLVSKDVFVGLLRECPSRKEKLYMHQACELLYGYLKSCLSPKRLISKEEKMGWILSEASRDAGVGHYLLILVSCEREKLIKLWGSVSDSNIQLSDIKFGLGQYDQAALINQNTAGPLLHKRTNHHLGYNENDYPRFEKTHGTSLRIKNQTSYQMHKQLHSSRSNISPRLWTQIQASEAVDLGRLLESHCSDIAETLFSRIQKTRPRPNNLEILSVARSTCCRMGLHAALEAKYGLLPENLYLKAAKLCSELNIQIDWHQERFICLKGCKPQKQAHLAPLKPLCNVFMEPSSSEVNPADDPQWEMDECHYVLESKDINWKPLKTMALSEASVINEDVKNDNYSSYDIPNNCIAT